MQRTDGRPTLIFEGGNSKQQDEVMGLSGKASLRTVVMVSLGETDQVA